MLCYLGDAFFSLCFTVNISWGIVPGNDGLNMGPFPLLSAISTVVKWGGHLTAVCLLCQVPQWNLIILVKTNVSAEDLFSLSMYINYLTQIWPSYFSQVILYTLEKSFLIKFWTCYLNYFTFNNKLLFMKTFAYNSTKCFWIELVCKRQWTLTIM